jgi:sugar diacid utilization regulator
VIGVHVNTVACRNERIEAITGSTCREATTG